MAAKVINSIFKTNLQNGGRFKIIETVKTNTVPTANQKVILFDRKTLRPFLEAVSNSSGVVTFTNLSEDGREWLLLALDSNETYASPTMIRVATADGLS